VQPTISDHAAQRLAKDLVGGPSPHLTGSVHVSLAPDLDKIMMAGFHILILLSVSLPSLSYAFFNPITSCTAFRFGVFEINSVNRCERSRLSVTRMMDDSESPRKRKEMPQYVQDLLKRESVVEDPLDSIQLVKGMLQNSSIGKRKKAGVMNTEIYVKGIPFSMDRKELRTVFAKYDALYARVLTNSKNSSRSLGYGFVGFKSTSKANAAIRAMNGTQVDDKDGSKKTLYASFAVEKPTKRRELASKSDQRDFKQIVQDRKASLSARDSGKLVMSADDMPRRWKIISDKVNLDSPLAKIAPAPSSSTPQNIQPSPPHPSHRGRRPQHSRDPLLRRPQ
jgi:hypothetical protein